MFFNDKKTLQLKGKVPGITSKFSAAAEAVVLAAAAATVVILVVLRKLLWLSQGLFLSAGVFFYHQII